MVWLIGPPIFMSITAGVALLILFSVLIWASRWKSSRINVTLRTKEFVVLGKEKTFPKRYKISWPWDVGLAVKDESTGKTWYVVEYPKGLKPGDRIIAREVDWIKGGKPSYDSGLTPEVIESYGELYNPSEALTMRNIRGSEKANEWFVWEFVQKVL